MSANSSESLSEALYRILKCFGYKIIVLSLKFVRERFRVLLERGEQ